MHYAVPALLARHSALARFYTDLHSSHWPLRLLKTFWPRSLQPKFIKRLFGRQLPAELPLKLVRDQPLATLLFARNGPLTDGLILKRSCQEGFGGANAIYTNFINNDLDMIRQAKSCGLYIVHELYITPDSGHIMMQERNRFPGIEIGVETPEEVELGISRDKLKWSLSDRVLVPSQYCLDSAIKLGCDLNKLHFVPYGIPEYWFDLEPVPIPGRILFVGHVGLRKGNQYLAECCRILKKRGVPFECRVAGPSHLDLSQSLFEGPNYLGQVPRSQIMNEFQQADLFVLPTLAEGMALVHLEAMACGVPVITTPNCGSVVRNNIDGFVVPIRDGEALANRIQQLLENRTLRDRMGLSARERARDYTWACYGQRLLDALGVFA